MKLHIVSDVHYRTTGLAAAGQDCDLFVCLGDLVLFLDYDDPVHGIFAETFGTDNARRYIRLRYQLRFDEARSFTATDSSSRTSSQWRRDTASSGIWRSQFSPRPMTVASRVRGKSFRCPVLLNITSFTSIGGPSLRVRNDTVHWTGPAKGACRKFRL